MARINPDEMDHYGTNGSDSEWLSLKNDGDIVRVQFLYDSYDELDTFVAHKVKVGDKDRYVDCKREYDDPLDACPFCAAGMAVKPVMMLSMYDLNDKKIKIWERGKKFRQIMQAKFNRYPNLSEHVFEIERHGKAGDQQTTYEIIHMEDVEPVDLSDIEKPEFLGTFILDKSADDMQTYLDTGSFPDSETPTRRNSGDSGVTRRIRRG